MDFYLENTIKMFPNAGCELIYHNPFEFLVAVSLSAQTTDKAVNKITAILFDKYKSINDLANANYNDVYNIIKPLGLASNKTKNLINLSKEINLLGKIPDNIKDLTKLSGIGIKTANVYMAEIYKEPHIAVDTHVLRVSKRLGLIDENDNVSICQEKLENRYEKEYWIKAHHSFLFLGRYICKSIKPKCAECLLKEKCKYKKEAKL
jgi:endonuclease-3